MQYVVVDIKHLEDKKPVSGRFFMQKIPNWIAVDASRVGKINFHTNSTLIVSYSSFLSQQTCPKTQEYQYFINSNLKNSVINNSVQNYSKSID